MRQIHESTRGIVFLGTRHKGNSWDFISPTFLVVLNILAFQAYWLGILNSSVVNSLVVFDDPDIEKANRLFRPVEKNYKIACCFANLPSGSSFIPFFVSDKTLGCVQSHNDPSYQPVPREVATLAGADVISLDAREHELGKFDYRNDVGYIRLLAFLRQVPLKRRQTRPTEDSPVDAAVQSGTIHGLRILCLGKRPYAAFQTSC